MFLFVLLVMSCGLMYFFFQRCRYLENELHKVSSGEKVETEKPFQTTVKQTTDSGKTGLRAGGGETSPPAPLASIPASQTPPPAPRVARLEDASTATQSRTTAVSHPAGLPQPASSEQGADTSAQTGSSEQEQAEQTPEARTTPKPSPSPAARETKETPINSIYDAAPDVGGDTSQVPPRGARLPKRTAEPTRR